VFGLVFALMATFVVVITASAAQSGGRLFPGQATAGSRTVPASMATPMLEPAAGTAFQQLGTAGSGGARQAGAGDAISSTALSAPLDARLAADLRPLTRHYSAQVAVGVFDLTTGTEVVYHAGRKFATAGIERADILAALLLRHQHAAAALGTRAADLAASMIEDGNAVATSELWQMVGGAAGLTAANAALKVHHTSPPSTGNVNLTTTTVADQLQLLLDLTLARAPLDLACRDYALGLLDHVQASQRWGVPIAASSRTGYAVQDGWLQDQRLWVVNSIGVIEHHGQDLLIAVLSKGNQSETRGVALAEAAATAAVHVVIGAAS